jgi:dTDP-glucose 4,6-dehydratase
MKLLVTGGLGFIGSNFIQKILHEESEIKIINMDAKLIGSNSENLSGIKNNKNYEFVKGNIVNKNSIEKLVKKVDVVINFAAETHVDRSIVNPELFLKSNLLGVYTILESVKKFKKKLIQISTDEVFGSLKTESANEEFSFNTSNPYSASKGSAELLINSYIKTFDCDVNITRCTNNFGPRQSPEKLIPKVISLAEKNQKIPIYGSGKNIRDWIFVMDHCDAILKVMLNGKRGESYNISASNEINNLKIIKMILKLMDKPVDLIQHTKDRPGHDFRYSLDSSKIQKKLKWRTKYNFEDGLVETITWYKKNKKWNKNMSSELLKEYR